jgi:hypothetical protein
MVAMLTFKGGKPMTRQLIFSSIAIGLALAASVLASAQEPGGYKALTGHYEAIRQSLLNDSTEGVAEHAKSIRQAAEQLRLEFDAASASVPAERSAECLEILPEIQNAAAWLESTSTIDATREMFGELSKVMVRYRQMLTKTESVVVYCSMAEKVWIQPKGEIGNPYYGQSMARCGEIVSE